MTETEIELKILEVDIKAMTKKLLELGAQAQPRVMVHAKHFDYPDGRLEDKNRHFRIRKVGDVNEIVFKDNQQASEEFEIYDETETTFADFDTIEALTRKLGFVQTKERQKYRTTFKLEDVKCEIDEYQHIPPYMEIEGPAESVRRTVRQLGLQMSDTTNLNASRVFHKYGLKDVKFVTFEK